MEKSRPEDVDFLFEISPQEVMLMLVQQLKHEDEWFLQVIQEELGDRTQFNRSDVLNLVDRVLDRRQIRDEEEQTWLTDLDT